jgi:hypothetical protein
MSGRQDADGSFDLFKEVVSLLVDFVNENFEIVNQPDPAEKAKDSVIRTAMVMIGLIGKGTHSFAVEGVPTLNDSVLSMVASDGSVLVCRFEETLYSRQLYKEAEALVGNQVRLHGSISFADGELSITVQGVTQLSGQRVKIE